MHMANDSPSWPQYIQQITGMEKTQSSLRTDCPWVSRNIDLIYTIIKPYESMGHSDRDCVYGEITKGTFQKIIDKMKIHAEFGKKSTFIDVGSGLGKPCLHVAQDPGVNFSFGIELSEVRWRLCTDAFNKVIQAAEKQASDNRINHKCFFAFGDIKEALSFDPFTHVYMYNHGFHPIELREIANKFNNSVHSQFLICYLNSNKVRDYGFDVGCSICSIKTSMAGSSRCHTAHIYKRNAQVKPIGTTICDPLCRFGVITVNKGLEHMVEYMKREAANCVQQCRAKRSHHTSTASTRDQWHARFSALSEITNHIATYRDPNVTICDLGCSGIATCDSKAATCELRVIDAIDTATYRDPNVTTFDLGCSGIATCDSKAAACELRVIDASDIATYRDQSTPSNTSKKGTRFTDSTLDPSTGSLMMKKATRFTDSTLNPSTGLLKMRLDSNVHYIIPSKSTNACCGLCRWAFSKGQSNRNKRVRGNFVGECDVCHVSLCMSCYKAFHTVGPLDKLRSEVLQQQEL